MAKVALGHTTQQPNHRSISQQYLPFFSKICKPNAMPGKHTPAYFHFRSDLELIKPDWLWRQPPRHLYGHDLPLVLSRDYL